MLSKKFDTLYDVDKMGRTRVYDITVSEKESGATILISHGLLEGLRQVESILVTEGKNLGKSNSTTPFEQAVADAQSKWNLKRDKGYMTEMGTKSTVLLPMLAQKFQERSHKIVLPCYVQPKLNGMRCLAFKENGVIRLQSRMGKDIQDIPHITATLKSIMSDGDILDGELYTFGEKLQDILSAIKNIDHPEKSAIPLNTLNYWVYDCPDRAGTESFRERYKHFLSMIEPFTPRPPHIVPVSTEIVTTTDEVYAALGIQMSAGYEGVIVRNMDGLYSWGERSNDLQKLKLMQDAEFKIVGVRAGTGRAAEAAIFRCVTATGKEFEVNPEGTLAQKKAYLDNASSLIGKRLTVRYQELTKDGIPTFGVGVVVRDYE
jgi:DNA ligase 1